MIEKVVVKSLSQYCETYSKLYIGQMGARKSRCIINAIVSLIYRVQESWVEKKLVAALFINIKEAFDYISQTKLIKKMMKLEIDSD